MINGLKKHVKVSFLMLVLAIGSLLTACGSGEKGDTIIVTDCSGVEVEISSNVQRVIAVNQPFANFMIAMGEGDKMIGSHGSVIGHTWAPYFYDTITSIEMYGYKPEAEAVLAADADLVVVKNAAYAQTLRDAGIPAIYFAYNNLEELYYAVDLMGDIFGKDAQEYAKKWKARVEETIDTLNKEMTSLTDEEKKKVYYINAATNPSDLYSTYGGDTFFDYWINVIGGEYATEPYEGIETIDPEVAISLNPDVIFISGYAEYTRYDELMADPVWSDINAVNNNEVYMMPTAMVSYDRLAVDLPMLLEYSANLLYPDRHEFGGTETLKEFYKEFYGKDFSDEELQNMLAGLNPDGSRMD